MNAHYNLQKVAVHGVPRSGTSWLGEIINSSPHTTYRYQPLFSYTHKDFLSNTSSTEDIDLFFNRLSYCDDDFTNQKDRRNSGDFPIFNKNKISHIVYKEVRYVNILCNLMRRSDDVVLIAIIRNPLSTINSWLTAPREFRKDLGWTELEEWRYALKKNLNRPEEYHGYEKWKEATNIFLSLQATYPNRVYTVRYEKLLADPKKETKQLFRFLNLGIKDQTISFLNNSTNSEKQDSYAVFRKKQSDEKWKNELNPQITKQIIEDLRGTHLEVFV